ncbi:MAG: hypothetical protein IJB74_04665 [Clostridia bacterium]|nr:hypothetical protein [Clostridia bacterium]
MKKKSRKIITAFLVIIAALLFVIIVPSKLSSVISDGNSLSAHTDYAPLLVAHRGFSSIYPQNTLPAFEGAADAEFDGYEIDIHTTKDGKWVVIHDDTVDKMTDDTGEVENFTFEEIRSLKIDGGNGIENYPDLKIPTLEEALAVCEDKDIFPVIEIKKCDERYLTDLKAYLDEKGLSDKAVIISFTKEYMEAYRSLDKEAEMLYLSHDPSKEDIDWCKNNNFGINFNHKNLYKCVSAVTYAKKQGVKIAAWTVDNTVYKDIMVLFGAEIITTNKIKPAIK